LGGFAATKVDLGDSDLPLAVASAIGFYAKLPFSPKVPKLDFIVELIPYLYSGNTSYSLPGGLLNIYARIVTDRIDFTVLRLNFLFSYNYNLGASKSLALFGGISQGLFLKNNTESLFLKTIDLSGKETITAINTVGSTGGRTYEQGLVGGIRLKMGKFGLDARYAITNGWEERISSRSYVKSFGLCGSYAF
jgi:hypothetical protein